MTTNNHDDDKPKEPDLDKVQAELKLSDADFDKLQAELKNSQSELNQLLEEWTITDDLPKLDIATETSSLPFDMQGMDVEEDFMPAPNFDATEVDVARWMLQEVQSHGILDQQRAAYSIRRLFGEKHTHPNKNNNLAISREVLKVFLMLTRDTIVWN